MKKGIILVDVPDDYNFKDNLCIEISGTNYKFHIRPLPEKVEYSSRQDISTELITEGWNACLNTILGETEYV